MNLTNEQKARLFDAMLVDGVDNWEGYQGVAYQETMEEIEAEAQMDSMKKDIQPLIEIIETNIEVDYPAGREAGSRTMFTEDGVHEVVMYLIKNFEKKINR